MCQIAPNDECWMIKSLPDLSNQLKTYPSHMSQLGIKGEEKKTSYTSQNICILIFILKISRHLVR